MARPARRNGMSFAQIYHRYMPGSKYKRRKGTCRCCAPPPPSYNRAGAKRRAIEEQS